MTVQIQDSLANFPERVAAYWEELLGTPQLLWKWTESQPLFRWVGIGLAAVLAAAVLLILISFFRTNWKGKLRTLLVAVVGFVALWALLIFAGRQVAGFVLPEAGSISLGGKTLETPAQYVLQRAPEKSGWRLLGPTVALPVDDDLIVHLSALDRLAEEDPYGLYLAEHAELGSWEHLLPGLEEHPLPGFRLLLYRSHSDDDRSHFEQTNSTLELWLFPDRELSELPFYLPDGETRDDIELRDANYTARYAVTENGDDGLVFLMSIEYDGSEFKDPKAGIARQIGPDLVLGLSSGDFDEVDYDWRKGVTLSESYHWLDPFAGEQEKESLLAPLRILFSEGIRCLRGLTPAERSAVLPGRIVDYPLGEEAYKNGGFAFPCEALLEMTQADNGYGISTLRFTGEGPDGESCLYTLCNDALHSMSESLYGEGAPWYEEMCEAFEAGCDSPDEVLSAFLGAPAVPWGDGWLLDPGPLPYVFPPAQIIYSLTMEPAA